MPKVRRTETYPCPGTIDEILALLGRVMALEDVEHISLNDGEPVYVERRVEPSTNPAGIEDSSFIDLTLEDMLSRIPVEEYVAPRPQMPPGEMLFEVFTLVGTPPYVVTHVLCPDKPGLRRWIGMEGVLADDYRLVNAQVVASPMLPPDTIIVFGGHRAGAPASEVKVALKLSTQPQAGVFQPAAVAQSAPQEVPHAQPQASPRPAGPPPGHPPQHAGPPGADGSAPAGDDAPTWFGPAD